MAHYPSMGQNDVHIASNLYIYLKYCGIKWDNVFLFVWMFVVNPLISLESQAGKESNLVQDVFPLKLIVLHFKFES